MTVLDAVGPSPGAPAAAAPAAASIAVTAEPALPVTLPAAPPAPAIGMATGRFFGTEESYWRLMIRGAVLLLVTLGIYRFWLATDQRRFLWANTEIAGDALEYAGTARELLIGFLIAMAVLVPLYVVLSLAALGSDVIGQFSGLIALLVLVLFGPFAIYRARRYRLTRTIFRGLRLHQTGSAGLYAVYSILGWAATLATFGLAYPWAQAALERYKMHHTFYGDVGGRFVGSGTHLFLRGIGLWLLILGPLLASVVYAVATIDGNVVADAVQRGGNNMLGRIESAIPNFSAALTAVVMASFWSVITAALLYPAFQAMMLRWWTSGLRFGDMVATSRVRTGQMYGLYLRFVGFSLLFGLAAAIVGLIVGIVVPLPGLDEEKFAELDTFAQIAGVVVGVIGYVVLMLGYSTIYQVTVKLRLWRLSFETAELTGLAALERVNAAGAPGSAFGEGLADALDIGGL